MRRYGPNEKTVAYKDYLKSQKHAHYLLKLEGRLSDPPVGRDVVRVNALRASATILLVANLEYYLRQGFMEIADRINSINIRDGSPISGALLDYNASAFMDYIKNFKGTKPEKLLKMRQAASSISTDNLYPDAFGDTRASPKPETVKAMFEALGCGNVWPRLSGHYLVIRPGSDTESTIIQKLRHLCEERNQVVHAGLALNIARATLNEYALFLEALALAIDVLLREEFRLHV